MMQDDPHDSTWYEAYPEKVVNPHSCLFRSWWHAAPWLLLGLLTWLAIGWGICLGLRVLVSWAFAWVFG